MFKLQWSMWYLYKSLLSFFLQWFSENALNSLVNIRSNVMSRVVQSVYYGPYDCILICSMNRGYCFFHLPDWFGQIPCLLFSCYQVIVCIEVKWRVCESLQWYSWECMEVYLHSRMLSWYSVCGIKEEVLSLPVLWCWSPCVLMSNRRKGYFSACFVVGLRVTFKY